MNLEALSGAKAGLRRFLESIPESWSVVPFGEVAECRLGKMLSEKTRPNQNAKPYLRNQNVQWGRFDLTKVLTIELRHDELERYRLRPGDLLVCEGGEVGRAAIWQGLLEECYYQKALHRVRPGADLSAEFLFWVLRLYAIERLFDGFTTGTTIAHLPQEALRALPIPRPPLSEQSQIVEFLERQTSQLEAGGSALSSAIRKADALEMAVLAQLVGSVGDKVPLHSVAEVRLGRQRSPKNREGPNMRPYLRAANVTWNGLRLDNVNAMNFTPSEVAAYALTDGDILLSEASGSADEVGKPALWRGEIEDCCFQNTLIRVRANRSMVHPEYLLAYFRRLALTGEFAKASRGVGIHHLGAETLASWPVRIPPLAEQSEALRRLDAFQPTLGHLKSELEKGLRRGARLRESVMLAALTGRLVDMSTAIHDVALWNSAPTAREVPV